MLPWNLVSKFKTDANTLRQILVEPLKNVNRNKNVTIGGQTAQLTQKQIVNANLPLYENLIHLEIALRKADKRFDTALKLCERLLKTDPSLVQLSLCEIYIGCLSSNAKNVIDKALVSLANDAQIAFVAAQYFISVGDSASAVQVLENLIFSFYDTNENLSADDLFSETLKYNQKMYLNALKLREGISGEFLHSQLLNLSVCYW